MCTTAELEEVYYILACLLDDFYALAKYAEHDYSDEKIDEMTRLAEEFLERYASEPEYDD